MAESRANILVSKIYLNPNSNALASVRKTAVILFILSEFSVWSLLCDVIRNVRLGFAFILLKNRELVALLYFNCALLLCGWLCLFLRVSWVGLWSVIKVLPAHTQLNFVTVYMIIALDREGLENTLLENDEFFSLFIVYMKYSDMSLSVMSQ